MVMQGELNLQDLCIYEVAAASGVSYGGEQVNPNGGTCPPGLTKLPVTGPQFV